MTLEEMVKKYRECPNRGDCEGWMDMSCPLAAKAWGLSHNTSPTTICELLQLLERLMDKG